MANADRIIELFHEAKARPPGVERTRFLAEACGEDWALKEQILTLLEAEADAGESDFLKMTRIIRPSILPVEKPGDRIGRYKLLEQIGEGGCGVVYMAEQEHPVRRRVALKVIKVGMDTKQVIGRFEAERQALALMDHPNIAKVLDAGATETGRPYFVMELVRGIKITDYCDQNNLSTQERLQLFTQVCQAIQHAHQKGIIHRDIKPSNILVTINEPGSPGSPKVIDFGIAKATAGERLTDKTVFTAFEQFIGTPAYMSPEQAMMTSLDIDTRTDVYALGVLLYELLTGTTPFDAKALLAAGLNAMRRIIHEQEPERPSTRLSTMLEADLTTVAKHRHSEPAKLGPLLRGDLDWIVMKALEKDRTRRYETANGLAMDIQRHLDNEPVTARPPSNLYRFQKLVRRNKLAVAAVGAVTAALILGFGVSTWMFFKEKQAREKAGKEAAKSQQVASFLQTMLRGVGPGVALGRDTTLLREILDKTAARIGRDLTNQPEVELELRVTLFNAYLAIGEADKNEEMARSIVRLTQSFAVAENVRAEAWLRLGLILRGHGKLDEAERCGREALAAYRKEGGKRPGLPAALMLLSQIQKSRGRLTEGEALCREAVATNREMFGNEAVNTGTATTALAYQLRDQGKSVEAESVAREALAILRKRLARGHEKAVEALLALTGVLGDRGKWAEAEALLRDELATRRQRDHPDTIRLSTQLGHALQKLGRLAESEAMLREAVASARKTWAHNPSYYYYRESFGYLLEVLTLEGKLAEAEKLCEEIISLARTTRGDSDPALGAMLHIFAEFLLFQANKPAAAAEQYLKALPIRRARQDENLAWTLRNLGHALRLAGKAKDAEPYLRESATIARKLGDSGPWVIEQLAGALSEQGKAAEAEATLREALAFQRKHLGEENLVVAALLGNLSSFLRQEGKLPEAVSTAREALAIRKKLQGNEHRDVDIALGNLARVLVSQGKLTEAEAVTREELALEKKLSGEEHPYVANSLNHLAGILFDSGKLTEAETVFYEGLAMRKKLLGAEDPNVATTLAGLTKTLLAEKKFTEAETIARECLDIREKKLPNDWITLNSRSMLGGSLLGQKKYADAEPLLVSAYEGMRQREAEIPVVGRPRMKENLQRLVQLYEATGQSEKAAEWNRKLAEFDKAETEKAAATRP